MPKDQRLYMTFPIDFDEHPKVEPLSDSAFRTFVSMNGYSRRQRLDGVIPNAVAKKRWKVKDLEELVASHPDRPLILSDEGNYVIRDYAAHQFTTADEETLYEKRSRAGSMGGKARASAQASAKHDPQQNEAESRSESESRSGLLTDVTKDYESSHLRNGSGDDFDSESVAAKLEGIHDLRAVAEVLSKAAGQPVSARGARELAAAIVSKSKREVRKVDAYVATTCRTSPAEVQQAYFDLDIGAYGEQVNE